jgi:endoglucanase
VQAPSPHRLRRILLASLLISVAACLATAASASATIRLGVYDAAQGEVGAPESGQVLDQYAATVGRKPDIVMDYSNLTEPLLTKNEVANLSSRGETPLVSWQLYQSGYSGPTIPLAQIAAGAYDADLRRAAAEAKGMPFNEILIRLGHEMNGDWYGWSGDPSTFVAAWRHVVSLFRAEGVTNVKWVWSANVNNGSYPFKAYFPGEEWIDYTGLDGYNWGTAGVGVNRWQTVSQVFSSSYRELTELSAKPVILTEVSSSEVGGDKAAWIREGFLKTIPQEFPRIDAVVWFDRNQEEDWRIDSSSSSLAAYREVVASSLYGGSNPPPAEAAAPAATSGLAVESIAVTATGAATANPSSTAPTLKTKKAHRRRLSYEISRKAKLRIAVKAPGHGKSYETVVNRASRAGSVSLTRLLHGRRPSAGTYRVTATAIDAHGARSKPRRTAFSVPRG